MSFDDRRVVVKGGGGALGVAVVRQLVEAGAHVYVPAHSERDAVALAGIPRVAIAPRVDLADEDAVTRFYDDVGADLYASIHIAGGFVFGPIVDASFADLQRMLSMNVASTWLCCREAARRMSDGGRIVNVSAKPVLVPAANVVAYAASKGAVATLTLGLAEELAPRGIWVNAIAPSIMDTPANRASMPDADFDAWPKVDEVARTIVFLASPANAVTRGALVPVYGRS
jgi:NAD(P)-dependent dehydrogenase (short-subunit alcohol dehydrogenase family)